MQQAQIAQESLAASLAIPSSLKFSSRDLGWSSLLIDQHALRPVEAEYETRATPDQGLILMTRGLMDVESHNNGRWRRATYGVGTVGLTPGGKIDRLRRFTHPAAGETETTKIYLPYAVLETTLEEHRRAGQRSTPQPLSALAFRDPALFHVLAAATDAAKHGASSLYADTVAHWLAAHLLTAHTPWLASSTRERFAGVLGDRRLARVVEYMSSHYAEPLSLDALAREAGISKFHFVRLFRRETGLTPHEFLAGIRMDAGRSMLLHSDRSIAEIAAACGYPRQSHFTTAFSARFGLTPSAVRGAALEKARGA